MSKPHRFLAVLLGVCTLVVLKIGFIDAADLFHAVRFNTPDGGGGIGAWFPTVHVGHNAWTAWRIDPFLGGLAHLCPDPRAALMGLYLGFFAIGLATFGLVLAPALGLRVAAGGAVLITALLTRLFAFDLTLAGALVWLPWLAVVIFTTLNAPVASRNRIVLLLLLLVFFSLRTVKGANVLAPFVVGVAGMVALHAASLDLTARRRLTALVGIILAATVFGLDRGISAPGFPDYPAYARLVPPDGVPGFTRALVGPDRPLPVIDRLFLDERYSSLALGLLLLAGWLALVTRRERRSNRPLHTVVTATCILAAAAWWDTVSLSGLGETSPLRTLGRIVPGLGFVPLLPLTVALSVTFFVIGSTLAQRVLPIIVVSLWLIGFSVDTGRVTWRWDSPPGSIQRSDLGVVRAADDILSGRVGASPKLQAALLSPSAGLIGREGLWVIDGSPEESRTTWHPGAPHIAQVEVSHRPDASAALIDNEPKTRWSASRGLQVGDEFVRLTFREPLQVSGVMLDTGPYQTDYPGGVRIVGRARCDDATTTELFVAPQWLGPIRRTESGLPFYGPKGNVAILFPSATTIGCLDVSQIGRGRPFDWSITEIKLRLPNE